MFWEYLLFGVGPFKVQAGLNTDTAVGEIRAALFATHNSDNTL